MGDGQLQQTDPHNAQSTGRWFRERLHWAGDAYAPSLINGDSACERR